MINFIKMDGIGNDFIIIDGRSQNIDISAEQMQLLSSRSNAATKGCDQLGIIRQSNEYDCYLNMYNSDGGAVEACGNITRCVAYLLMEENSNSSCAIDTISGIKYATRENTRDTNISINMGQPKLHWQDIPLANECDTLSVDISSGILQNAVAVNVGNPHAVFFIQENIDSIDLQTHGAAIENHKLFPRKVNVSIVNIVDRDNINMRVFERSVGETLACGTAACASVVAAARRNLTNRNVKTQLKGGDLNINWLDNNDIIMTGAVNLQFTGSDTTPQQIN